MRTIKTDKRSKYTQEMIKRSLLKLMGIKPLTKITVAELCTDAGVNRITFYNHFNDIYDVYNQIENDFLTQLLVKIDGIKTEDPQRAALREIILLLYRNVEFCAIILNSDGDFIHRLMDSFKDKYMSEVASRYRGISQEILHALYTFQVSGNLGLVADWIKRGMLESPEAMTSMIERINKNLIFGFFGRQITVVP